MNKTERVTTLCFCQGRQVDDVVVEYNFYGGRDQTHNSPKEYCEVDICWVVEGEDDLLDLMSEREIDALEQSILDDRAMEGDHGL
jgi:hypothetical protein